MKKDVDKKVAQIPSRPSGKAAYDRRTLIIQVAHMVHEWRTTAGLTQPELAKAVGTKQSAISKLESYSNDHMPNIGTLIDIAHACGRQFVLGSTPPLSQREDGKDFPEARREDLELVTM